jgi:DNA-directed RNA polymerase specialized sigma24 family protein
MENSITQWIVRLKKGDAQAAERLWEQYFDRLTGLARARLAGSPRKAADEEDVALSVFDSLCRGAARGQFPKLSDRHNLWALLLVLTARKVCDYRTHEQAQKRGRARVVAVSELDDSAARCGALESVLTREPTPGVALILAEECASLLNRLDGDLRRIALGKMEGLSNREVASQLNCGLRTIERRLDLIRRIWTEDDAKA